MKRGRKCPAAQSPWPMEQSFRKKNQWLYLKSWNCQNSPNFAQPAKEWLKELGQVGRRVRTCLTLDSELVSYLNSHQKMQFRSLRERGPHWKVSCISRGPPNRWWQPDASPGEHRDRSGDLKSSAARGQVPSSHCQTRTKERLMWAGSLRSPQSSKCMGRERGVFSSRFPHKAHI